MGPSAFSQLIDDRLIGMNCKYEDCPNDTTCRGYCPYHYNRERDSGNLGVAACAEADCDRYAKGRGFCNKHYIQKRRDGVFGGGTCSTEGCGDPTYSRGWCNKHYLEDRARARGVEARVPNPAWYENSKGYMVRKWPLGARNTARHESQHRIFMEEHLGRKLMDKENVHHINGVRDDNRIENLELWSTKQPYGQRVADKTAWAKEWLAQYDPDSLAA